VAIIGPCGAYRTVQDEGVALTRRTILDFAGAGVTATDDAANSRTLVTIPGASSGGSALTVVSRTERTTDLLVTGGNEGGATTVVTAPAFTPDGTSVYGFQVFGAQCEVANNTSLLGVLFQDGAAIGTLFDFSNGTTLTLAWPMTATYYFTPTNASHTYSWRAWRTTSNCNIFAGSGGAGHLVPAYLLITKIG
jgi:hypothetical protein